MLTGPIGRIEWGYYVAADVHGYTVTRHRETRQWSLTGIVGTSDAFKLSQRPLTFVAPYNNEAGKWTWPIRSITITDRAVRAELDPPK